MNNENMPDFTIRMNQALDHIYKAQQLFARGPLQSYLEKLVHQSEALLTRFSPIKIGGRAIIIKYIECTHGWKGSEQNLAVGVEGKVTNVDYQDNQFYYTFVPDVQKWRDRNGEYHDSDRASSYILGEQYLHKVESS